MQLKKWSVIIIKNPTVNSKHYCCNKKYMDLACTRTWKNGLMIFIQKQILLLLTFLTAQESQFQQAWKPQICFASHCPCTLLGPPVPVTFSYSPATWNLFDNPDYWLIWLILNIGLVWLASSTKRLVPLGFLSQCFYGIVQNKRLWQKWQHYFNAFCVTFLSIAIEIKFFIWIFITCRVLMSIWILCWTMLKKSI